jgi:hypothetical protein
VALEDIEPLALEIFEARRVGKAHKWLTPKTNSLKPKASVE